MADERPCTIVRRVPGSESAWIYVFAKPVSLGGSLSVGQTARPVYYYMRNFQLEYLCECGGKSASVFTDNNFEIGSINEPDLQVFMTANVAISMPAALGSAATQVLVGVAEAVLGSVSGAVGWLEPDAVKARGEELLSGEPTIQQTINETSPVAVCGDHIRHHTGVIVQWPPVGDPVPPPTEEEEATWRLHWEVSHMQHEFGSLYEKWARQILVLLEDRDPKVQERGRLQAEALRQTIERLTEIFRQLAESVDQAANNSGH
jgi:hypothetical protein